MREKVAVSLVQFAPEWLERDRNAERMKTLAEQEARVGAELIVFPELANIGFITPVLPGSLIDFGSGTDDTEFGNGFAAYLSFGVRYVKAAEPIPGPTTKILGDVCKRYGVYIVVGVAELHPRIPAVLHNSAVLVGPHGIIGVHRKVHLPNNEKLYFCPGNTCEVHSTDLGNIAMTICYDGRYPELTRIQALKGAEILCAIYAGPMASMDVIVDVQTLKYIAHTRAKENCAYYLACSRSGKQGNTTFLGHSAIAAPNGEIIAYSDSEEEEIIRADLRDELLIRSRLQMNIFRDRRPELYALITEPLSETYTTISNVTEPPMDVAPAAQS